MFVVVGIKRLEYEKNGKNVQALEVHVQYEDLDIDGFGCENYWCPADKYRDLWDNLKLGDQVDIRYNKFGKLQAINRI